MLVLFLFGELLVVAAMGLTVLKGLGHVDIGLPITNATEAAIVVVMYVGLMVMFAVNFAGNMWHHPKRVEEDPPIIMPSDAPSRPDPPR